MVDRAEEPAGFASSLVEPTATGSPALVAASRRLPKSALAWSLYEGVRTPYVILVTIYIFMPYFATVMVGDPVKGQGVVATISTIYGLIAACTAPFLGAMIDRSGPRKPLLALVTAIMVVLMGSLWFAKPDGSGLSVLGVCIVTGAIGILFSYGEVLHNALLPHAASPAQTARASGLGLAMGGAFSVVMLVFVLWAFALPGKMHLPFLPSAPLFGLSAAQHETDRIVAPLEAVVFALGAIPLFLLSRDAPKGLGGGLRAGLAQLGETLKSLKVERDMRTFLLSRMLYTDGLTSILFFTGVYAAGVLGWRVLDLLVFGILMSIFAFLGGSFASVLDRWVGAKRSVQIEIATVLVCEILVLGFAKDRMFYMPWHGAPLWSGPVVKTLPELVFLGFGCINAAAVTGAYASSRVMLTRLCTPERAGSFFGLYALSGTVTLWLGSLLVKLATGIGHSQQAGFVPIAGLLLVGLAGLSMVRVRGRLGEA